MHAAAAGLLPYGCSLCAVASPKPVWDAGPVCLTAGMYYGGEPVEWTDSPAIPHEARYEIMNKPPPAPKAAAAAGASTGAAAAASGGSGGAARPAGQQQYAVAGSRVVNKHPLADVRLWEAVGAPGIGAVHDGPWPACCGRGRLPSFPRSLVCPLIKNPPFPPLS